MPRWSNGIEGWPRYGIMVLVALFTAISYRNDCYGQSSPIDIHLGEAQEDPLIQTLAPTDKVASKLEFTADGLLVEHTRRSTGEPAPVGFVLKAGSPGDFVFMLEFDCRQLTPSKSGWGQGLLVRFVPEDATASTLAVGYIANRKQKGAIATTTNLTNSPRQEFLLNPVEMTKGTLLIVRSDTTLTVSLDQSGSSFREIQKVPCGDAAVKEIQVVCTRTTAGDSPSAFLLERVRLAGDEHLKQPRPPPPFFTLGRITWTIVALSGMLAIAYAFKHDLFRRKIF